MMAQEFASVWDALEPKQSANMKLRSELMIQISEFVKKSGHTQVVAAKQLGVSQPRLNDVLKGRIDKCTVDRLVNMLDAVGYNVELNVFQAA